MRITELDLLAELKKIQTPDQPTEGWFPPEHYQKEWNLGLRQAHVYLNLAVKEGKLEKRKFVKDFRACPYYRAV